MTALHLITNGRVDVSYPGGSYPLGKGDVIGICEICSEIHLLSYTTLEDTTILTYPLTSLDSLNDILQKHPDVARLFLLSCFRQINILLNRSSISELNCSELYRTLNDDISTYKSLCDRYRIPARSLEHFDELNAFLGDDSPDIWLNGYYMGLNHILASDNYRIMVQEVDLPIGMLRKGSLDFRRTYQSLEEQFHYLQQIGGFYFRESGNDLFDFYTSLYYKLGQDNEDSKVVYDRIQRVLSKAGDLSFIDQNLFTSRAQSFQSSLSLMGSADSADSGSSDDSEILGRLAGSLNTILEYAGPDLDTVASFRQHVHAYKLLSDRSSQDQEVTLLRRQLTEEFYLLYSLLFTQTLKQPDIPMPVRMFLYFGYVDEELAGLKNAVILYRLAEVIHSAHHTGVVVQLCGADLQPLGKGGHHRCLYFGGNGGDEQLLLGAHAAADQNELRVEDVHHACKALCNLVRPVVQQGKNCLAACFGCGKDGAAVLPIGVLFLCGAHQRGGGSVAFPAALCAAGTVHTVQRVGAVVTQLTAKAPCTL